ncbi:MAG: hypothetical protein A2632_02735 [Candidatus Pacebacteria bacterium RIFCSPHIGHO2_01_FULL_46_16]|nr:MAG: hypothetical protein A2632_02735 [Candidatus Pacebacteria bacterium RIFCSPHIGHO2_01_FULL_46_16]OGJ21149.1 MAG: hypothetical protein A3J60_01170 [Candidatus Pacebacteria bacterium RIFCSPHIGHO2_02_FULL_46_9]OGJ38918.1 MAG: hypothetical protein A3A82_02050 [Candidatus Pacebacteria bacterium RIFCSPLOWO2_01_FULL_47_12]
MSELIFLSLTELLKDKSLDSMVRLLTATAKSSGGDVDAAKETLKAMYQESAHDPATATNLANLEVAYTTLLGLLEK